MAQTQNFEELLKDYFAQIPQVNDLVKGKVISIGRGEVRVDINGIIIGVVRGDELFSESKEFAHIKIGDDVEATVIEDENENGEMELSFRVAGHRLVWERMAKYVKEGTVIKAKIIQANKGGLMLQADALTGFMPVSQLNPDNYPRVQGGDKNRILEHLKKFVGTTIKVKVLDANVDDEKLIFSEKEVWEEEQKNILDSYKVGDKIEGEVSALTPFGAFVKFGEGLEGLVHISEIVWQRIDHPKDILKVGDKVKAQIIDLNKSKIYLSLKRLVDDPWKSVKEKYTIGQIVKGEVHKVESFGLMVKLDNEIHGLAHISDLSDKRVADPKELLVKFEIGKPYNFEIISIEPAEHRLGLRLEGVKKREAKKEDEVAEEKKEEVKTEEKTA
ncbi:MAG TPA: S1 RNA-binding domain-containing protein [Candidatus Magasanikbacteria bacterium]|nr:S1 RNA-binding domain-containing protein [Candidatus Magasanikbacteria bacterium]